MEFVGELFEWRGPLETREKVAIVALDEPTMAEVTPWPPPRTVYAELLDGLFAAGARVVAIDVMFAQPQSPATDAALAAALKRHAGKVVLAANVQLGQGHEAQTTLVLPQQAFQDAATLSGGEKTKLALAQLVAGRHNLLLLDEPTNNLDPPSRVATGEALSGWPGAMIIVSHDVEFVRALAPDRALLMPDGTLDYFSEEMLDLVELA